MRAFRSMLLSFVLIFWSIIGISISEGEAFTYYGEFRWKVTLDGDPEFDIIRLGVGDMGGGHFILSGRDEDCECVIQGNGEVIGSNVILILHAARNNEGNSERALEVQTYHITLSLNSLDGTYKRFFTCCGENPGDMVNTFYESGTFEFLGRR